MILLLLAFLGGILTIISPCILPVLPFVFAKADQPFRKSGLPLLAGMAVTFAGFAAIATVGGSWVVRANQYGRVLALVVLAIFGVTLLWPALADAAVAPFCSPRQPAFTARGFRFKSQRIPIGSAWNCHRIALGALRRTDSGLDPHWRGARRGERTQRVAVACVRGWRRDFIGRGVARWWTGFRRTETVLGSGIVDTQRPRHRRAGRGGSDCARTGSRRVDADFARQHVGPRTVAHRPLASRSATSRRNRVP